MASFSPAEKRFIGGMGLILSMRTLGFSLIVPVFSLYSTAIPGATEMLAGLAVGIFGFTQTVFQVPMGRLSDVWGRKQTAILGLAVYCAGTVLCGLSQNIYHLVAARFLAGAGAVSGVTMAWLTDGIGADKRNHALSIVGVSIGLSVILGFMISPLVAGHIGIPFLFFMSAALILGLVVYIAVFLENSTVLEAVEEDLTGRWVLSLLKNTDLLRLNLVGFIGNLCLVCVFFIMPILITREMPVAGMWKIFVTVALAGTASMFYFSRKADKKGTVKIASLGILLGVAGAIIPVFFDGMVPLCVSFLVFYSGYCVLQPVIPAAVSRYPDAGVRGMALGLLNSFQFTGSGLGGLLGGFMLRYDHRALFGILALFMLAGMIAVLGFREFNRKD
jgi:MFS family permease